MRAYQETEMGITVIETAEELPGSRRFRQHPHQGVLQDQAQQIRRLEEQAKELQQRLADAEERFMVAQREGSESRVRADTIILQLSQQLDRAHLQLVDQRQHAGVWQRMRAFFTSEVA